MQGSGGGENPAAAAMAAGIRKGPWMAEEDAVLMEYVRKHGPRDWSSIRSKGLLPRTGKSCRLRWVNKLKPDLKTGCKFSLEEEHIVIDLQARFGNKWARIATYLPGRTDNDVKNFWSTRQKRLARLLQTPLPTRTVKNQGKAPMFTEMQKFEPNEDIGALSCNIIPLSEEYQNGCCSHAPLVNSPDAASTMQMLNLDANLSLLHSAAADSELCLQNSSLPSAPPFGHSLLDLPLLPEGHDHIPEFSDVSFSSHFACAEPSPTMQLPSTSAFLDLDAGTHNIKIEHPGTPDSFFNDFPTDMFDCLEQPPAA